MKKLLPILVLIFAGAAVHGAVTQRWSVFGTDSRRTQAVHDFVITHADCEMTPIENDVPLKERSQSTSRRYVSATQRFAASTAIISGVPGAVATHTPDVCYTASGFTMKSGPKKQSMTLPDGRTAHYFVADFEKTKATQAERVRVRWAWFAKGTWDAPNTPRFHYMSTPELFKLYVVTGVAADDAGGEDSPAVQAFVQSALVQYAEAISP